MFHRSRGEAKEDNAKIVNLRAFMVVIYYIKLFRMGANKHSGILISQRQNIINSIK